MFVRYRWLYNLPNRPFYEVTDDDFVECVECVASRLTGYMEATDMSVIIDVYERRKLEVVPNLFRAMQQLAKATKSDMRKIVSRNKKYNPKWKPYADEIDKFLILL